MKNKMGTIIAQKRKEKNMTQKDLAEKLFVTDRAVSKWERNLSYPDIELLKSISEILDVTISELINGEEIKEMTDTIIDQTIDEGIEIYRKKDRRKFIKRFVIGTLLFVSIIFIVLNYISEINYGEVELGRILIRIPNSQVRIARKKTDKVMTSLKEKNYKVLNDLVLFRNTPTIDERLDRFYNTFSILECERDDFYYNGRNYEIRYKMVLKHNNKTITIYPHLIGYKEVISFEGFASVNGNEFIQEYPEAWEILISLFSNN